VTVVIAVGMVAIRYAVLPLEPRRIRMPTTFANLSMSLDGYIAGPNVRVGNGMGDDGDRLHDWIFAGKSDAEATAFLRRDLDPVGAFVMGRTMFDVGVDPWGDEPPFRAPVFVVTHRPADSIEKAGGTTYHFVTDGPGAALERARREAGDRDVRIEGGADIVRQFLAAGALDEFRLHVVPIVLGGGTRLFDDSAGPVAFVSTGSIDEGGVAHLTLRPGADRD
jgi:dihydrofolate reductase